MNLYQRLSNIETNNPYFKKDLKKAQNATKFIGRGSDASSTNRYMVAAGDLANCSHYTSDDVVFISAEGMRRGRKEVDFDEIGLAVASKATFVTDAEYDRNRPYNLGERQVATYLLENGYEDNGKGVWCIKND